jgi:tetratricopeptide (TPR) repeat protein
MSLKSITDNNNDFIKKAILEGLTLVLEEKRSIINAVPLSMENNVAIFVEESTNKFFKRNVDNIRIVSELGPQVTKEEQVKNINNINNRKSDIIVSIDYWDDKFKPVSNDDEEFKYLKIEANYFIIQNVDTGKIFKIRLPFLRYVEFEGQKQSELLSNINQPSGKYFGYKYYNAALALIGFNSISEITDNEKVVEIKQLLLKAIEDLSISTNTSSAALKILGEIEEQKNNISEAIVYYKKALDLNPKIGLKNKLKKLLN